MCQPKNGPTSTTRHGAKRPVRGRGRIWFSRRRPVLVRRIPGHRPALSQHRVQATCWQCAAPARRGPARVTDRTTGLRPWCDSSMAATPNGGERKCEVQSLSFFLFRVRRPIRDGVCPSRPRPRSNPKKIASRSQARSLTMAAELGWRDRSCSGSIPGAMGRLNATNSAPGPGASGGNACRDPDRQRNKGRPPQ